MQTLKIALAQINSTVGDISGNGQKIIDRIDQAKRKGVDLIAFPELCLTGYPPEDLLLKSHFIEDNINQLKKIVPHCSGIAAIIGFVDSQKSGKNIHNAAAVIYDKKIQLIYHKCHLPNYGVFDEARYFQSGLLTPVFVLKGVMVGVNICEDIWHEDGPTRAQTRRGGAKLIINISASPYRMGVGVSREKMLAVRAKENTVFIAYVNMVGGQDELVFDGGSLIFNAKGKLLARGKSFEEELMIADVPIQSPFTLPSPQGRGIIEKRLTQNEEIYRALQMGVFDYVHKNQFKKTVIAISGGIDSALTAVIAVDAFGKKNVVGVFMPSRYTSKESDADAKRLAENLGIRLIKISIEPPLRAYFDLLASSFGALPTDTTEENLQSRIRGNIIMALSNKFGWLVLTTGNKSEMSVGYATLYGDMAGGFAVIKDIWKKVVYQLARYRNRQGGIIPVRILTRPPTAELRSNQKDCDTLPPYAILDPILEAYIEKDRSFDEIVQMGFDTKTVAKVISLVDNSEFKRRQAPLGVKITPRGLGKDRRMPITNRYFDKGK
ncbi:MAG: NAD+ synthase [Nitrospirae bacterium]|nr:NAD+ synthase [Candidatus Troglogloeales bacterium]